MKMNVMKRTVLLSLMVIALLACKGERESSETVHNDPLLTLTGAIVPFSDVENRDWQLAALRNDSQFMEIDRIALAEYFDEIFTLHFAAGRLSGVAAPNRYFAPYTLGNNQDIAIGIIAGTLMAALFEPEELKEGDYFSYLQNTHKWNLTDGNLELHTKAEDGTAKVLVFAPTNN
jgi:heat shock protein HslJ